VEVGEESGVERLGRERGSGEQQQAAEGAHGEAESGQGVYLPGKRAVVYRIGNF
jgi:hypothetical protein